MKVAGYRTQISPEALDHSLEVVISGEISVNNLASILDGWTSRQRNR